MNFKKLISLLLFLTLFSGIFVFGATQGQDNGKKAADLSNLIPTDFSISKVLAKFGTFYEGLKTEKGNSSHILDGIAILVMFAGLYSIFFNLTRFVFKGENNKPARKGASVILSIMITGALVTTLNAKEGFVSFYGGRIILLFALVVLILGYIAYVKWINKEFKNGGARVTLWASGLIMIDITLSSIIKNLFSLPDKGSFVQFIYDLSNSIGSGAATFVFIGAGWWLFTHYKSNNDSDDDKEDSDETAERKELEAKEKEIKTIGNALVNSLVKGNDASKNKTKFLNKIQQKIHSGGSS